MDQKKQNILQGALILTASTMLVKVIGALFKIPLANILGGVGMSYFVSAYDVFIPIYSMTVTGLGIATSRLVSECSQNSTLSSESVLVTARRVFLAIGVTSSVLLFAGAGILTNIIGNPGARITVCCIAPSIIFACASAAYRGYFQGKQNMLPTAKAQVLEAIIKMLLGAGAAYLLFHRLTLSYRAGSAPAWLQNLPEQSAQLRILQIAAAGAVAGVTFSMFCGMIYIRGCYCRTLVLQKTPHFSREAAKQMLSIALPIALTSLSANLTTLIDLSSVMNCLQNAVRADCGRILEMYSGCIPPEVSVDVLPEYLYGSYSGLAVSIFNLVPALTAGIGISAIPTIAAHRARGDDKAIRHSIGSAVLVASMAAFPAGLGISTFSEEILLFLYPNQQMEVAIVAPILRWMGLAAILVSFSGIFNNILQAVGMEKTPLFALLMGGVIKMITNFILVSRPDTNIHGVAFGSLMCYGFITVFCIIRLIVSGYGGRLLSALAKPLPASLLCCAGARLLYDKVFIGFGNTPALLCSVISGGIIYLIVSLLTGCMKSVQILSMISKWK